MRGDDGVAVAVNNEGAKAHTKLDGEWWACPLLPIDGSAIIDAHLPRNQVMVQRSGYDYTALPGEAEVGHGA